MSLDIMWDISVIESVKLLDKLQGIEDAEEKKKAVIGRCHTLRYMLEPYIYNYLLVNYGPYLDEFWKTYIPPKKARYAYCLVERRPHPNFWFLLRNMAWAAPQMSFYIFCSDENYHFIMTLLGDKAEHFNVLIAFKGNPDRETAIQEYNDIYTDFRFYNTIEAEYILTFQMDAFIRKKLDMSMFCGDYYACPWSWRMDEPGGGGTSVRRVAKLSEICQKYRPDPDKDRLPMAEDAWINEKIMREGIWPSLEKRCTTFMESVVSEKVAIVHQFWSFTDTFLSDGKDVFLKVFYDALHLEIDEKQNK